MSNSDAKRYFNNIDKYSKEHIEVINKFTDLLESMKAHKNNPEQKSHISDIHNSIKKFNDLIEKHDIKLTQSELNDIDKINSSDAKPVLKKRMLEDLFHRIRKNHKDSFEKKPVSKNVQKEIDILNKHRVFFFKWFELFMYSLNYNTITLISHNYKDLSLSKIKNDLSVSLNHVLPYLKSILDKEYYIFSIIEYNSLVQILNLSVPVENINKINWDLSYNASKIYDQMKDFCEIYLKVFEAANTIDTTISKLASKRKLPHGFYGHVCNIIDFPVLYGKQIKYSGSDLITKSIRGSILSYFTSKEKKIVSSINQVKYLLDIDVTVNNSYKELTEDAIEFEKQNREIETSNTDTEREKYNYISDIFQNYIPYGKKIADNILKEESGHKTESWIKNYELKPMFLPVKLVESLIKNYIERINTTNSIIFRYDGAEFTRYFENRKEIRSITKGLNSVDLGITGGKLKELLELSSQNEDSLDFIKNIATLSAPLNNMPREEASAKVFIDHINSKVYSLASTIHEIIKNYEERKVINFELAEENYDFFTNAEMAAHRVLKLNKIIGLENITLESFLKSLCALCYYIAETFCSPAIEELRNELARIQNEYNFSDSNNSGITEDENKTEVIDESEELKDDINENPEALDNIDQITGLHKFSYFNNVLKKEQYSDLNRYKLKNRRFLFSIEIKNFHEINNKLGHDSGDRILKEAARILKTEGAKTKGISLFKYKNANIFGICESDDIMELVKYIQNCAQRINLIHISKDSFEVKHIHINCGIFEERKNYVFATSFEFVRRLMHSSVHDSSNNIITLKNSDIRIKKKDFLADGSINRKLLNIYR